MRGIIKHKIVRPWAEQGELVHACTVQLAMLFTLMLAMFKYLIHLNDSQH